MSQAVNRERRVPCYQQCAAFIAQSIEEGRYSIGEFLPPERELSRQFCVNRLTLRKGLQELVKRGVLESVPGSGNRVVLKQGTRREARVIGCVMKRHVGVRTLSPYYADIFGGIESAVTETGYSLVFSSVKDDDLWAFDGTSRVLPQAINPNLSGVLMVGGVCDELAAAYRRRGADVVYVDRCVVDRGLSSIVPDNRGGAYEMARYLLGLGHRRIAFLGARLDPVVAARMEGLAAALDEAGLAFREEDFIVGDYEIRPACLAVRRFLAERKGDLPTAIMAVNDEAAMGALKAVQEAGLHVPRDISVAGFDDIQWAVHTDPPLSTVRIPREEMGYVAARVLMDELDQRSGAPLTTVMRTEVVVRESCASPRL